MPLLLLVVVFIALPLAELWVLIQVGDRIGIPATIAVLLLDSTIGSLLLRSQGRAAWRRFNEATASGRVPAREVLDGTLVIFGGALLLTPGFLTDVIGLLLLIPPSRAVARRLVGAALTKRVFASMAGAFGRVGEDPRPRRSYDVEGSASEPPASGDGPARLPS